MSFTHTSHPKAAAEFVQNTNRMNWHDEALWFIRTKRDRIAQTVPDWELLRQQASEIKAHTLSKLDTYLQQFEENAIANGVTVHWAADAAEHNAIVLKLLQKVGATKIVKSKSMLTEECHLNPFLEKQGIEVVDTDLGERIVQLRNEPPSHIVLPAIHIKKEEVGQLFHEHLGTKKGSADPQYLTNAAREHLRQKFLAADAAITGVNFAVAETGGFVVCTNEGNADLGAHLAKLHIACMGIEKVIPQTKDLGVFLRLLARSATGQAITTYSSHFVKPAPGAEMHIVIVDNGRSTQLGREDFRNSLKCIRCGACMNTCPVYRRSGGHSYHNAVAGPIGAILAPNIDMKEYADLPFASTLCGSCTDVCPVKIDIHNQLYKWRQVLTREGHAPAAKKAGMKMMASVLASPKKFSFSGKMARRMLRWFPKLAVNGTLNPWGRQRELPKVPDQSFREWYKQHKKETK
ncbi:lactate utilization protein [Pseudoflavitalea sp. G-6-1-2]|uniref:lactate utilization protein B n=1 Tax=Pseudoflavitalea sp. G-6-1-2 TaxID=2728841 RepID=UPI00146EDBA0|nr:lactate utilization protein B [Pseudoflavitalea sp. G-6-1-2]NML22213.1 lactate utilization protein [Pseudoflavitalea sp. G-6-1-2]